jgi:putative membrane protein
MLTLSIHIAFVAVWAASLVYFPYLFSEQSQAEDRERHDRLVLLQRWIYAIVMTPCALIAVVAGTWLAVERGFAGGWLQVKLAIVLLMVFFHAYCGKLMVDLKRNGFVRSPSFYRWLPIAPIILIVAVVSLVVGKPF